jgi:hypothetical protein
VEFTEIAPLAVLHVPPAGVPNNGDEANKHMENVPAIEVGMGSTVTTLMAVQPVPDKVYVTDAVPANTPVTTPVVEFTVAKPVYPTSLHVPGPTPSVNGTVAPTQTCGEVGLIGGGAGFTVSVRVTLQIPPVVAITVTVPEDTPVSKPENAPIVAIVVGTHNHVTPLAEFVNVTELLTQTDVGPRIGPGIGNTVIVIRLSKVQPSASVIVTE